MRLLVVEDDEEIAEQIARTLRGDGFTVDVVDNGADAPDQAAMNSYGLVVLDIMLPGMDGWAATRQLKTDERTRAIPVVALTGHALAGASDGARQAGCDAFVTKPCLPDELVVEVRRMLDRVPPRS